MRKKIVAGNWKMHGSRAFVADLLGSLKQFDQYSDQVACIVFPPNVFLSESQSLLQDSAIAWGGQTLSEYSQGAYTGEVSADMLLEFACRYVLVGHSERRQLFSESNLTVAKKFMAAKQAGLTPVLCVGETLAQREAGETEAIVAAQIQALIELSDVSCLQDAVIAYEPVWAIGTGKTATPEQAQQVHQFIRQSIASQDAALAQQCPILYGGSVKPDNAADIFQQADVDGGLIGGAALKSQDFLAIYQAALTI